MLSMVGIAFSTAALIIVLSVFNGLEGLLRSLYTSFDPEIKIELVKGKSFEVTDELLTKLKSIEEVDIVTEVIEDYAYVRYRDADMVVTMKGMSDNFIDQHRLDNHLVDGQLMLRKNGIQYAIIGRGVQYALSVGIEETIFPLQVFYIKNSKSKSLDPSQLYAQNALQPGGVFSIEKTYDENFIFVPLDFARDLLNYGNKRTALEIKTKTGSNVKEVQSKIRQSLGDAFHVLTNEELHKDLYRLLKIEKLFTFLALSMLIVVASINIFFSLMMLALDKKKDIAILTAIGAHESFVQKIFLNEGALIAFLGAAIGLVLGGGICWLQDAYGLVGMGMENAIVNSYPVKMKLTDFLLTALVIISITAIVSFYPAHKASRTANPQLL